MAMRSDPIVFFLVIGFSIIFAFLIGIIRGLSRSNQRPIIQLANTTNGQPESAVTSTAFTYFVIFFAIIALVYFLLQKYDMRYFNTSTVENRPRPYIYKSSVPTTNLDAKETDSSTSNSAQDAQPSPATLTLQPDIKVYEQLAAFHEQSNTEQAKSEYQHLYPGKQILATDIPNTNRYFLVFIELSEGYDADHFMKNHRNRMPLRTKAEILPLFSQPF